MCTISSISLIMFLQTLIQFLSSSIRAVHGRVVYCLPTSSTVKMFTFVIREKLSCIITGPSCSFISRLQYMMIYRLPCLPTKIQSEYSIESDRLIHTLVMDATLFWWYHMGRWPEKSAIIYNICVYITSKHWFTNTMRPKISHSGFKT